MDRCKDCMHCYRVDSKKGKCQYRAWIDVNREDKACHMFLDKPELIRQIEETEDEKNA